MAMVALAWCLSSSAAHAQGAGTVKFKVVNYDGLGDLIRANPGKVILVDFWSLTCVPCKENFPHVVEMYKKYKDKGLVCISVCTDDLRKYPKKESRIQEFLQDNEAIFTNVVLDMTDTELQEKLRITSLPCMYVFDRQGKWRQFIGTALVQDGKIRQAEIETLIVKLLE
jgi:thiol-disulfide isomerase/thioredoxin